MNNTTLLANPVKLTEAETDKVAAAGLGRISALIDGGHAYQTGKKNVTDGGTMPGFGEITALTSHLK